jgi:hypothetical protein
MSEGYWYVAGLLCEAFSMICTQISFEREVLR